jgi:hypothetical protein
MDVPLGTCFRSTVLFLMFGATVSMPQIIRASPLASAQETASAEQTTASNSSPASTATTPSSSTQEGPAPATASGMGNGAGFLDKLSLTGLIDMYYGYNFNSPDSRKNELRNFDVNSNQFSLNLAKLTLERLPDPLGFRVDMMFGDAAKIVNSAEPGGNIYQYVEQAYASYKAPLGKGLTIDFGKFVTQHGAEVIESRDNWNYSRSLLFSWAIPYYHFGARAKYPLSDALSFTLTVSNGWNDVVDNNTGKTYGFQVAVNPTKKLSIVQNYMVGPEQSNDSSDLRHLWDTTVTYTASSALSFMGNYDYGMDRATGSGVKWQGVAGYAHLQVNSWFAISPRLEWFTDPQGFTTGSAQNLKEGTLTAEFKLHNELLLRGEYRQDRSNQPFFEKHDGARTRNQQTATLGLIYYFAKEH